MQSKFYDNIKSKHSCKLFVAQSYIKVLRLAMKVDQYKYYDGVFFGVISSDFHSLKSLSLSSRKSWFKTLISLDFSFLSTSLSSQRNEHGWMNGKSDFSVQYLHNIRSADLPESNCTFQTLTMTLPSISEVLLSMVVMAGVELKSLAAKRIRIPCHNQTWNPCRISSTLQSTFQFFTRTASWLIHFLFNSRKSENKIHN